MTEDRQQEQYLGAIAFYAERTYCAYTKVVEGQFVGAVFQERLPTTTPDDAFAKAISFFKKALAGRKLAGLGISLYGVVDTENAQFLGSTQVDWTDPFDVWDLIERHGGTTIVSKDRLKCHTDAAAAAIAEYLWGAAQPIQRSKDAERKNLVYFKIQDGIGSGVILAGRLWQGSLHPEMGHIPVRRAKDDPYFGGCPIHNDCAEGLASSGSMIERLYAFGLETLNDLDASNNLGHKLWALEAYYLAQLAVTAAMVVAPQQIIFEGDIIRPHLFDKICSGFQEHIEGYPAYNEIAKITAASFFGHDASLLGALEQARRQALESENRIPTKSGSNGPSLFQISHSPLIDSELGDAAFVKSLDSMRRARTNYDPTLRVARSYTTGRRYSGPVKIFGLSVTETIEWATAYAEEGRILDGTFHGDTLCEIPDGTLPHTREEKFYIQDAIRKGLENLFRQRPQVFEHVAGIGVSTVGDVDRQRQVLTNISRKPWFAREKGRPVIDFPSIFLERTREGDMLFSRNGTDSDEGRQPLTKDAIIVQNDATARGLVEYLYGFDGKRPKSMFHIIVGEGVNGTLIHESDLSYKLEHTKLGHCVPRMHEADVGKMFENGINSGCPSHGICFEGVASSARFRQEHGRELWELPQDDPAWDIEAFYLSQLAMNGALMFTPDCISFGGAVFYRDQIKGQFLLNKIHAQFRKADAGYLLKYRTMKDVRELIVLGEFGEDAKVLSALTMGCLAAFRNDRFGQALTVGELSARCDLQNTRQARYN